MSNNFIFFGILILLNATLITFGIIIISRISKITSVLVSQNNAIIGLRSILKRKNATNAVAENAELIYQDLLQNLIPIMATLNIMPRQSAEHPLWRALGGIMDEFAKNPFVLEHMRRAIKLDPDISRNTASYLTSANKFLEHLNTSDPDGILTTTFTNGLLGESISFFTQARELANA